VGETWEQMLPSTIEWGQTDDYDSYDTYYDYTSGYTWTY